MGRILIVDDEPSIVLVARTLLARAGHSVSKADNGTDALRMLKEQSFDLLLTDVNLPGVDGITLLSEAKKINPSIAAIVMTAYSDVDSALDAMQKGASDFLVKPFNFNELLANINRTLMNAGADGAVCASRVIRRPDATLNHGYLVGSSLVMQALYKRIDQLAAGSDIILLRGAHGTGKEITAKSIHFSAGRSKEPFVTLNCAVMPKVLLRNEVCGIYRSNPNFNKIGLFENAATGTILLKEMSSLAPEDAEFIYDIVKNRSLKTGGIGKTVDIKASFMFADTDPGFMLPEKYGFKFDELTVPLLSERVDDIPQLIVHFLYEFELELHRWCEITDEAVDLLKGTRWHGNVRQLELAVKRLASLSTTSIIDAADVRELEKNMDAKLHGGSPIPYSITRDSHMCPKPRNLEFTPQLTPLKDHVKSIETFYVKRAVANADGDLDIAAERLGMTVEALLRKMNAKK